MQTTLKLLTIIRSVYCKHKMFLTGIKTTKINDNYDVE